jgi:hypothetical protein
MKSPTQGDLLPLSDGEFHAALEPMALQGILKIAR